MNPREQNSNIEGRVDMIEEALHGGISGKPGLMQNQARMIEDLYKDGGGALPRLRKVEEWQIRKDSWLSGASFASSFLGSTVGMALVWVVTKYIIK